MPGWTRGQRAPAQAGGFYAPARSICGDEAQPCVRTRRKDQCHSCLTSAVKCAAEYYLDLTPIKGRKLPG